MNLKPWLLATRPKTLPASLVPVLIGTAAASSVCRIDYPVMAATLVCAILIQIITNYINEYYDFRKGADTNERVGPQRMVASGIISPIAMRNVSAILILITFALGLFIVAHAGWVVLLIGVLCLLFAYAYTGGPYPLAYKGLGDIFVFIFFGIIATCGTFFAQTGYFSVAILVASIAPGLLSMNILGVNNLRDIETDPKANKITLSVRIGKRRSINLYIISVFVSYCVPMALYLITQNAGLFLPIVTLPFAMNLIKSVRTKTGKGLNPVLEGSGKLLLIYGILLCIGWMM